MKKNVLITALICLFTLSFAIGQTFPNPGFETWVTHTGYMEPTGWGTINPTTNTFGFWPVTQETVSPHSGSACIKLQTTHYNLANLNVLGAAASGKITIVPTPFSYSVDSGFACNTIPQNLKGFYKDTIGGPRDSVYIITFYTHYDTVHHRRDTVAHGSMVVGTNNMTWTAFTIPITIDSIPTVLPDTGMIVLHSSRLDTASAGTTLWVDDLTLTAGINEIDLLNGNYELYPNPAVSSLNIQNNNFFKKSGFIAVYDEMGKNMATFPLNDNLSVINTKSFAEGIYFYEIKNSNMAVVKKGKFIVGK